MSPLPTLALPLIATAIACMIAHGSSKLPPECAAMLLEQFARMAAQSIGAQPPGTNEDPTTIIIGRMRELYRAHGIEPPSQQAVSIAAWLAMYECKHTNQKE